jgi:hypothetical protein
MEDQGRDCQAQVSGVDADLLKLIFAELKERAAKQCRDSIRDILSLAQYAQKLRKKGLDQALPRAVEQILARPDAGASKE